MTLSLVPAETDDAEVTVAEVTVAEVTVAEVTLDEGTDETQAPDEQVEEPIGAPGCVVAVFSPKGGAGTTVLATNLAFGLADGGNRQVCLVDLDLEFGDIAITSGAAPTRTIVDAVGHDSDEAALDAATTVLPTGVSAVLAPIDPAAGEAVSPALVGRLLAALQARYDYVVVDTPCSLGELTLEALDAADHHVLVTTPDLPALKNLRLVLDTLDLLGADRAARHVVLNQAGRSGLNAAGVAEALRAPVAFTLPVDSAVPASVAEGRPLLARRRPSGPVVSALRELTTTIAGDGLAGATSRRIFRRGPRMRSS